MKEKPYYKWSDLNRKKYTIVKSIIAQWHKLLEEPHRESVYHSFLSDHAGFFLADHFSNIVISKLKISTSLETDFVVVHDGFSGGNIYELIEIEKPSSRLFNSRRWLTCRWKKR